MCDRWVWDLEDLADKVGLKGQRSLVTHRLGLRVRRNHFTLAPARRLAVEAGLLPASLGLPGWTVVPSRRQGGRGFRFP